MLSRPVRCDLISPGKRWLLSDIPQYERLLGEVIMVEMRDCHLSVDNGVFQITGIEMDDAISIARNLVEYTTAGKFKQRSKEYSSAPVIVYVHMKPLPPIERSHGE